MQFSRILRTKLIPPPRNTRILPRPRVNEMLKQALEYRLTILQAEAGYGKSTALAEFTGEHQPVIWYQANDEDNDPLVFLLQLSHALQYTFPQFVNLPTAYLETWDGTQGPLPWRGVLDGIINAITDASIPPTLLILDDAHLLTESGELPHILDRFIALAPVKFHILLAGRPTISLPGLTRWRAKGEALILDQSALTFTKNEIGSLFSTRYGLELTSEELDSLLEYTEGWAIGLQLIWQSIRSQSPLTLEFPFRWQTDSLETLFDMLAHEVFERQQADVREFLLVTAVLRDLNPEVCDALYPDGDSISMLAYLRRQDLFVAETAASTLRYHHIFHNFLRQQSPVETRTKWHLNAAQYFIAHHNPEDAIYHLIEAKAWEDVADLLDTYAATLLSTGRLDTLASYIDSLPSLSLHQHPTLMFTLGELARMHSRFDEAQGWYKQAEVTWRSRGQQDGIARALRGQARVYLDTVNPSQAEKLLEEAIRLSDGFEDREAQVRLFELLSENKLNSGHVEEAERLRQRAEDLRAEGPSNDQLWFRVLLRTGRLEEARKGLEELAEAENREPVQTPRAHRETKLLLSLIYSLMGMSKHAYQSALEGTQRGDKLKSPYVTAVGHMRQGHALNLIRSADEDNFARATSAFETTISIGKTLEVPRLSVEANWGLCRAYGYRGDLQRAQRHAQEAIDIAVEAGDEWVASLTRLSMGASLMLAARYEAAELWLNRAVRGFEECSDSFGRSAASLWLAYGHFKQRKFDLVAQTLPDVLSVCQQNGYSFLFTRPTLLGPVDERMFMPLVLHARQLGWESGYIDRLLDTLGLREVRFHPGFRLSIETLGNFQVKRGGEVIPPNGWRREKSRQLFQLLFTYRKSPLDRDQICEHLWPEADPATAQRNFKITLNTLYQVLEPDRDAGSDSAFIVRDGTTYTLRLHADLWLDSDHFTRLTREGLKPTEKSMALLEEAVKLYRGDYLPDSLYESWSAEERERLASLFLEAADKLCELYLTHQRFNEAIDLSQRILTKDNCWERAYRHLMQAYNALGDRGQLARTYQRCQQTLKTELDVLPSQETQDLYKNLIRT
ncbi:MAG TPA: BTAD domain-containing putative transcriptional regulator [Anaerolineales bacterium]|nr:BTAD domain-containing putative transcriptional regulator [Anaerolineales bacterium]HNC07471.1 BTAD domain-containing putative transcriptional regulator [Anaerolineales bacterium]